MGGVFVICRVCALLFCLAKRLLSRILEVFSISTKELSINEQIKAKEVRVIDSDGSQLGIMKISDARNLAYDKELDLVEIAAASVPPVCRIMDYGKYRFEKEKKEKEAKKKQQTVDIKEIQLSCRIDTHDFNTKLNHAKRFLTGGDKVKVSVKFKGRELAHTGIGLDIIKKFGEECAEFGTVEKPPVLDGRQMLMFLAPKTASAGQKGKKSAPAEGKAE